jgi:polyferredoxin
MSKQQWLRYARWIIASVFLAGFIIMFSDIEGKVPFAFYSLFTSFQFVPSVLKFITMPHVLAAGFLFILLLTIFTGRVYCSAFCPLGIMQDVLAYLRRLLPKRLRRRKYRQPINILRYSILGLLIISLFITGIMALTWLDPYANFGRISSTLYQPVFIGIRNVISRLLMTMDIYTLQPAVNKAFHPLPYFASLSVFLIILAMVFSRERLYCNTICPAGTFFGLVSKISWFKLKIDNVTCTSCGKCQAICKANCIDMKLRIIDESRCVSCYNCINVCEGESILLTNTWKKPVSTGVGAEDKSKREFLKSGIVAFGTLPMLSFNSEGKPESYYSRGPVSPPGALSIEHLKENCIGCQLCISTCPTKVLQPAFLEYGFTGMLLPRMDNAVSYCNYECIRCTEVCPTGALVPLTVEQKKSTQIGHVLFNKNICIVKTKEKSCGSCSEHCPTQAVYMVPYKNGLTIPETNISICIGCGACEHACPVKNPHVAIYVIPNPTHKEAQKPVNRKVKAEESEEFPF